MKKDLKIHILRIAILVICYFPTVLFGQIALNNSLTTQQLVDSLKGSGVTISNVVYKGVVNYSGKNQIGYFSTTGTTQTQFGLKKGIVLTTGNTADISGAQSQINTAYSSSVTGEQRREADATILCGTTSNFNLSVLEFDFVPSGDSIKLRYVFSSSEYPDATDSYNYNCADINDRFAFLLSKNEISGGKGYINDAINFAVLPNDPTKEVCINAINNGVVGSGHNNAASYCQSANSSWTSGTISPYFNGVVSGIAFNGNTKVLTAKAKVTPKLTYHIKIFISDATDSNYDSAIFLEMGSFTSPESMTTSIATPSTHCAKESYYIRANVTGGTSPYTYKWSNGVTNSGKTVMADSILVSPTTTSTYTLTVTDSSPSNIQTSTASVVSTINPLPLADAGGNQTICFGDEATLTASGGDSYLWSNSLGNTTSINASPVSTTTYTVTVTHANSCTASDYVIVTVNPVPQVFNVTGGGSYCAGGIGNTIGLSGSQSGMKYQLQLAGSNTGSIYTGTGSSISFGYKTVAGPYSVVATNSSSLCPVTMNGSAIISINTKPVANAGVDQVICNGLTAKLIATGGDTYNWSSSLGTNDTVIAKPTGTTVYTVTVTASNSCTATDNITVTVNPKATTPVITRYLDTLKSSVITNVQWYDQSGMLNGETKSTYLPQTTGTYYAIASSSLGCKSDTSIKYLFDTSVLATSARSTLSYICQGGNTKVIADASFGIPPYTYTWSYGDQRTVMTKADTIIVSPTVTTTYTVTVSDSKTPTANTTTNSIVVTVSNLSAATLTERVVCANSLVSLGSSAVVSGGVPSYTYIWSNGSISSNPSVNPSVNSTYTVTVSDTKKCSIQNTVIVSVTENTASINAGKDTTICSGNTIQLNATGATTYTWTPTTYLSSSTISNPLTTPTSNITYTVIGTQNGCTASDQIIVVSNPKATTPSITFYSDSLRSSTLSYNQWYGPSGIIAGETQSAYLPSVDGDYYIIANNVYNCPSSASTKYKYYSDIRLSSLDTMTIRQIINMVSMDTLTRYTRALSGEDMAMVGASKVTITPRSSENCRTYITEAFTRYGLTPVRSNYSSTGSNIYAIQQGLVNPNKIVIISAHYDQDASYAADDDASGSAAVMEAARVLSKFQFDNTIVYALWDEEESGKLGSSNYASAAKQSAKNIIGVLQLEMFGYDGNNDNRFEIHVQNYASSIAMKDLTVEMNSRFKIGLSPIVKNPGTTGSDHSNFWYNGFGAICTSEAFFSGEPNPYYHTVQDRISVFNLPYFHKLAKLNISELAAIANVYNVSTSNQSVSNARSIDFRLFPNPANNQITIQTQERSDNSVISICNLQGQELIREKISSESQQINISKLKAGVYLLNFENGNQKQVKKFVKFD